jgi:hypothetical protein
MKAKAIKINTGAACGTWVTRVENNDGELLGFIRVVNIDWTATLYMGTYFAVHQCNKKIGYDVKLCGCLADAYEFLGISIQELDETNDFGEHPYDEK